jgi:predicted transcriptional regulator
MRMAHAQGARRAPGDADSQELLGAAPRPPGEGAGTQPPYVSRGDAIVAALKKGPMSFQAIAREINNPPSSVPQFLEPLLAKGTVIRIGRGIYALRGRAPAYVPTCDAIVSTLTKKPMKLGPLVQHVTKSTRGTRSRSSIRTVLSRLTKQGIVEQEQKYGKYRLVRRVRAARRVFEGQNLAAPNRGLRASA